MLNNILSIMLSFQLYQQNLLFFCSSSARVDYAYFSVCVITQLHIEWNIYKALLALSIVHSKQPHIVDTNQTVDEESVYFKYCSR